MTTHLRKAINLKCKECLHDPDIIGYGTWLRQVQNCTSPLCPLFEVRPRPRHRSENQQKGRFQRPGAAKHGVPTITLQGTPETVTREVSHG